MKILLSTSQSQFKDCGISIVVMKKAKENKFKKKRSKTMY
jgi:hypothetical protein